MPRQARRIAESGFYHITMRGIGRQLLFEGSREMELFIAIVARYRDQMGFKVIAWCLMGNHAHLLIESPEGVPSDAMKRIALSFAQQHNRAADHAGHVFQDRFGSNPVETDEQLLTCTRYIHDNPEKAGICRACEYPWSSFHEYAADRHLRNALADTELLLGMLGGRQGFISFSEGEAAPWSEPEAQRRMTDGQARELMDSLLSATEREALEHGTKATRNAALAKLKAGGLSVRQIERLTGIGRGIVLRA